MKPQRASILAVLLLCSAGLLAGCVQRFFKSQGSLTSDGGTLSAWSRPVQGCSPDPTDGLPVGRSVTLFTLYWDNPVERDLLTMKLHPPKENQLQQLEIQRSGDGFTGLLKRTRIEPSTLLDASVCSTFKVTTSPGKPEIAGGRPTVDGSLDLDCRVQGSHVTAAIRFTGCEY